MNLDEILQRAVRTMVGLGGSNPAHEQRLVAKPPKVADMNPRQLAAHRKRQRRVARNKALSKEQS